MALLLNIDTATDYASVCIADNESVIAFSENADQKNHAGFLQPAIQQLLKETQLTVFDLDAIAVSAGPGSYTGLRVGLASAKGLCYAAAKPLIMLNTLQVMANAVLQQEQKAEDAYIVPMIDARRMEVFTAVYDSDLKTVMEPAALILQEDSFDTYAQKSHLVFCGNGSTKYKNLVKDNLNCSFSSVTLSAANMVSLSLQQFNFQHFQNLAYSEPFYLKAFYTPLHRN